jgi:hypothetical protein
LTPGALFLLISSCALYLPTESFIFTHSLPHSFTQLFFVFFHGLFASPRSLLQQSLTYLTDLI